MILASPWIAGLVALFLWWFSTGAILCAVRRADRGGAVARRRVVILSLPLAVLGSVGFWMTLSDGSLGGAYLAFFSALALWGWAELAFLAGIITGPNDSHLPPAAPEWERFLRAWGTIAYHELLLVALMTAMVALARGAENLVGVLTFGVLFAARVSAKLNLYLGVSKINTEFLPEPLTHLPSHFRSARMNWLFPISITALTFATAVFVVQAVLATGAAGAVGYALVAALTALALLEHWFLVLPLPDERLWRWMLPEPHTTTTPQATRLSEDIR
ncbi:MAG: putative photosynthetic complex assembly protein PuhE [Pseudomonadota bacterium]